MAIKITSADKHFSNCVKERAGWSCERCGKHYPEGDRQGLDCCHIWGRAKKSVRHDPLNAVCMCRGCHQHFTSHPVAFHDWLVERFGSGHMDILREKSNRLFRGYQSYLPEISKHYLEQHRKLQERRANGETGILDFEGYL